MDLYENNAFDDLVAQAEKLNSIYPFIKRSVMAHIERQPKGDFRGRPVNSLKEIMTELDTEDFGPIFREFCKRESIYGFGDLQVKRLFLEIQNNR